MRRYDALARHERAQHAGACRRTHSFAAGPFSVLELVNVEKPIVLLQRKVQQSRPRSQYRSRQRKYSVISELRCIQSGKMGLQPTIFLLHPILFQVKSQPKEEQLYSNICFPTGQEPAEAEVCLQEPKCTLHLN